MRNIVVIPGLFHATISHRVITELEMKFPNSKIIKVNPGPVSSLHDRATEVFYELKGGRTDYGEAHSKECGHNQKGRVYKGKLTEWNENNPIDIISYSLGGPTARFLQHLMILKSFTDEEGNTIQTSGSWIRSITTINGCNNGSHTVHAAGLGIDSLQPIRLTVLWILFQFFYIFHYFGGTLAEWIFPLNLSHWECSRHEKSFSEIIALSPMLHDNAGRDLSPKRMYELNNEMASTLPHHSTHYFAFISTVTIPLSKIYHRPSLRILLKLPESFLLVPLAFFLGLVGSYMHSLYGLVDEEKIMTLEQEEAKLLNHFQISHAANDGVVSVAGQRHPHSEKSILDSFPSIQHLPKVPTKGAWHNVWMPVEWSHMQAMRYGQEQMNLFSDLLEYIEKFD